MVDSRMPFDVCVYDKDAGVMNTVHTTPSLAMAKRIAKSIQQLITKDEYKNPDNGQPYDWATIFHGDKEIGYINGIRQF